MRKLKVINRKKKEKKHSKNNNSLFMGKYFCVLPYYSKPTVNVSVTILTRASPSS